LPRDVVLSGADNMHTNMGVHCPLKFGIAKMFKILCDLGQLSTLSANISGTDGDIVKR